MVLDRFFREKLLDDINTAAGEALKADLGQELTFFYPLDTQIAEGDNHLKRLRFLFSIHEQISFQDLNRSKHGLEKLCARFCGPDYETQFHIGYDHPTPATSARFLFFLQFYYLANGLDHRFSKSLIAGLIDDPQRHDRHMPHWLTYDQGLTWADVVAEGLAFYQLFVSNQNRSLFQVRHFEAAFWRFVNLACAFFQMETFEELHKIIPSRFAEPLLTLPFQWIGLRKLENTFGEEDWHHCCRNSLRFCQLILEAGDHANRQ